MSPRLALIGRVFIAADGSAVRVVALDADRVQLAMTSAGTWIPGADFRRMLENRDLVELERAA